MKAPAVTIVLLIMLSPHRPVADERPQAPIGRIEGRITDGRTGEPMTGVRVLVLETLLGDLTDTSGRYDINGIPVGSRTLRVCSVELPAPVEAEVAILNQSTTVMDFGLRDVIVCHVRATPEPWRRRGNFQRDTLAPLIRQTKIVRVEDLPLEIALPSDLPPGCVFIRNDHSQRASIGIMLECYEVYAQVNNRRPQVPSDYDLAFSDPELAVAPPLGQPKRTTGTRTDSSFPTPLWTDSYYWTPRRQRH